MQRDLTRFKILGKFSILQFMFLAGTAALIATVMINAYFN